MLGSSGMLFKGRPRVRHTATVAVFVGLFVCVADGRIASAHGESDGARERPLSSRSRRVQQEEDTNPLRLSALIVDQSMTTQTVSVGSTPQSYVPLYELWFSLRPLYWFDKHWSVRGRWDYTKELTNNQATTNYREDVVGDIWTDFAYSNKLDTLWRGTKGAIGLRALWPTSKVSQANGTYVTLGPVGRLRHDFEIKGDDAPLLNSATASLAAAYQHPFTTATTPTDYGGFHYSRQDVDGFSFLSDQVQGSTLPNHVLWIIAEGGLQITPKFSATADLIFINNWHYAASNSVVNTATGAVAVPRTNDVLFTQNTWLLAHLDYDVLDELTLGFGYYNLANAVAPDGHVRGVFGSDNIWWIPDARFFFDATLNLDAVFDDAVGHKYSSKEAAHSGSATQVASSPR